MRLVAAFACLLLVAQSALGQQKPLETASFDALEVKPAELPKDVAAVEGLHCVSPRPGRFFASKSFAELSSEKYREEMAAWEATRPKLLRRAAQSFQGPDGEKFTAIRFECDAEAAPWKVQFENYLWNEAARRDRETFPEELVVEGRLILILSSKKGAAAGEWFKDRLRRRFGMAAPRWTPELADLRKKLENIQPPDVQGGILAVLAQNEPLIANDSALQVLRAQSASRKEQWKLSEKCWRRAQELHTSREDPIGPHGPWLCIDGIGVALIYQKRLDESVALLTRASEMGRAQKPVGWTRSLYNLACAQSIRRKPAECLAALEEAIEAEPYWKERAPKDADFNNMQDDPQFRALLGLDEAH